MLTQFVMFKVRKCVRLMQHHYCKCQSQDTDHTEQ